MENAKELLLSAEVLSKEKNLDKETVLDALADGLATALRRNYPEGSEIKVATSSDTLNISDSKTTFNNTPIKVEPNAYSLIFIMKYKDLD